MVHGADRAELVAPQSDTTGVANLVLDRMVVPELKQERLTGAAVAEEAWAILRDPERSRRQRAALADVASRLAGHGTLARVAEAVIAQAERRPSPLARSPAP